MTNKYIEQSLPTISTQQSMTNVQVSPNSQVQTLDITVPLSQNEWGDQFNQQIIWLGQQKIKSALIKLNPQELGPLEINLKIDKQAAQLNINSHSVHVRDALDQAIPRLREMMAEQGVNLTDVNIEANTKNQDQSNPQQPTELYNHFDSQDESNSELQAIQIKAVSKGIIDYFA